MVLAASALALTWLDYLRFARTVPGELLIFRISGGFPGLGAWAGARIFAGRRRARPSMAIRMPSAREMDVLPLIADSLSNKEIAPRLNVSSNTVKTHVARVPEKLEVSPRSAALARAREPGLLPCNRG